MTTWIIIILANTSMFSMPAPAAYQDRALCREVIPALVARKIPDATVLCVESEERPGGTIPMEAL